jgi:hypothetical protein
MAGLAAILVPSFLPAQITFQRTYGGGNYDDGESVQQTADSGYVVAGYTWSFGAGGMDVYLIKTDGRGETLWTRTFGGTNHDGGNSVQQTADGGYIIGGFTYSFGAGHMDVYLIKIDAAGDTLWTKSYGGAEFDNGSSVQQTADGGYIIAGTSDSYGAGSYDVYLIKTDGSGETLWTRTFGGGGDDEGFSVQQTADSGYIVAGHTNSFGAGGYDVYLVRTDARGDTLWTRTFGGDTDDLGSSVQQTSDGGYIIAGYTSSYGAGLTDVYLIKTDVYGDTTWTRTFGGPNYDWGNSVQQTADSGYIVAGYTNSFGAGGYDAYLIKTDAHGDTMWTRTFGGAEEDQAWSVHQTSDGDYAIAGCTQSSGAGGDDVYLIKTDADGNVAVAEPKASPTRAQELSVSCEPNPFAGTTTIRLPPFAIRSSPLTLRVYDAQGCRVRSFTVNRTPYTAWDGTDDFGHPLPSGTYFIRLDTPTYKHVAKLVKTE